jgi:drug/metabolite transporter (DMT)-like permease
MIAGRSKEALGVAAMVAATALWGATFVVIRDSLYTVDPYTLVFVRFGVAAALFTIISAVLRRRFDRPALVGGVLSGVLTTGAYLFQAFGLTSTSAGSSAFLTCAGTLFAGFFAWPILRQRPGGVLVLGIAMAVFGAALLTLHRGFHLGVGEMWTLLGALTYALQIVVVARYIAHADPLALVTVQTIVVALMVLPLARDVPAQLAGLDAEGWLRFAYLATAASVVAPFLQVLAQRALSAGRTGLLFGLEPLFGLAFALSVGGERFAARWWWGAALILAAVVIVEWPALRKQQEIAGSGRAPN